MLNVELLFGYFAECGIADCVNAHSFLRSDKHPIFFSNDSMVNTTVPLFRSFSVALNGASLPF